MIWLVVALVGVCAAFSGTYMYTGDIWTATFAGGIPALFYMAGLAVRATCSTASRACRIAVMMVAITVLTGVSAQFMVLSSRTRWQSDQMVGFGESLDRRAMMCTLFSTASPVFASYQHQATRKKRSVADAFKAACTTADWKDGVARLESPSERVNVYASETPDGAIMLTAVAVVTHGEDPGFVNVDGTKGFLQSRVCIHARGMSYEIEN